jgi:hypothetical protein
MTTTTSATLSSPLPPGSASTPGGHCWKSASLAGKRIRFGTNRVTISAPIGWNHRRVVQLPSDLHLILRDLRPKLFSYRLEIRCIYLILSLFPTGYEPGASRLSTSTNPQPSTLQPSIYYYPLSILNLYLSSTSIYPQPLSILNLYPSGCRPPKISSSMQKETSIE